MATKKTTVTKTKKYTLTPKEAEDVIKQEFFDNRGNKFTFRMIFEPHSHKTPTINGVVDYNYKDKK